MSKRPGITIRQPVRAQAATFAPGNVPTAADYGPWEANIGGFVWLSDGVTNTPFPDGWTRNNAGEAPQAVERHITYATRSDLSDATRLSGSNILNDALFGLSGDIDDVFAVTWILDGARTPKAEAPPFLLPVSLTALAPINTHTVTARVEYQDGGVERISASFSASIPVQTGAITADRSGNITIIGQAGNTAPDLIFNLDNTINATVTYSVTDDQTWISGSIVGSVLTLSFPGINALAAGAYSGTAIVTGGDLTPFTITVNLTVTAAATYQLVTSDDASFTNPAALVNATLSGSKYIGVLPTSGISSIVWNLDGVNAVTRTGTPFDFGAEATATAAALYDTSVLANGAHTLTATITPTGGQRNYMLQSQTLSTAPWSNFTTTVTPGTTLAGPEGSTLMLITQNTGAVAVQHTHSQLVTKPSAASLQWQVKLFIKPDATNPHYYFRMIVGESSSLTGYCSLYFRLDPGNVGVVSSSVPAGGSSGWSIISSSVTESSITGIYVVSFVGTSDAAATIYPRVTWNSSAGGPSSYAASVATGALMAWQLDFGAEAMTAYTPTTTTQVIGTGGTPTTLTADFSTQNAEKLLTVDKPQIVFSATAGGSSPAAQTLTLTPSIGTAAWTSAEVVNITWLSTTASGSATPAAPSTVTFTPTLGALTAGQYSGVVRFSATGYASVDVPVQMNVQAAAPTYDLYWSATGVGVAPVALLQGATTPQNPFVWLANTASPSVPVQIAAGTTDRFRFWNTAITDAQEATVPAVYTVNPGSPVVLVNPGPLWEASVGPKNYHWALSVGGVVSRGNTSYTYGSTSAHKHAPGVWLRVDRLNGRAGGAARGTVAINTYEDTFAKHPACKGLGFAMAWRDIEVSKGVYDWVQVDACIAKAVTYGKKAGFNIIPEKWGGLPAWIEANPLYWDASYYKGTPNWTIPEVQNAYKSVLRAFSQRYDNNPNVIWVWTDEAWWDASKAWDALTGTSETSRSAGWYKMLLDFMNETPQNFAKTHFFIGSNAQFVRAAAPGGNFEALANAGVGIGIPDGLKSTLATAGDTQAQMIQYKGRVAGLLWGDAYSMGAGNFNGIFPNRPMASYKQNADWTVPNAIAEYNPGTTIPGGSENTCWRVQYFGLMAYPTSVRNPPGADPATWVADTLALLNYVQANGFPNTTPATNLINKA